MSRVEVKAEVHVYSLDNDEWGRTEERIGLETWWNDDSGDYATLVIGGHRYTVAAADLRAALNAVTTRR